MREGARTDSPPSIRRPTGTVVQVRGQGVERKPGRHEQVADSRPAAVIDVRVSMETGAATCQVFAW